jgi:hypothetical protein
MHSYRLFNLLHVRFLHLPILRDFLWCLLNLIREQIDDFLIIWLLPLCLSIFHNDILNFSPWWLFLLRHVHLRDQVLHDNGRLIYLDTHV